MTEPHGLMFHHFRGGRHVAGQGAISAAEFAGLIDDAGPENILSPDDWIARAKSGTLRPSDTCITFDDALRCQYEIALPVLRRYGLTAFWFVYSSVFDGVRERLEVYRYFRSTTFPDVDAFYAAFLEAARSRYPAKLTAGLEDFAPERYLSDFPFYSTGDRLFRFVRDRVLGEKAYFEIMDQMIASWSSRPANLSEILWMDDAALAVLKEEGHEIGLHSYSHPTALGTLPPERQRCEFERNRAHLMDRHGITPRTMSHPCNSYDDATLAILRDLGIEIGFCSNRAAVANRSLLEMPREDHANLLAAKRKPAVEARA